MRSHMSGCSSHSDSWISKVSFPIFHDLTGCELCAFFDLRLCQQAVCKAAAVTLVSMYLHLSWQGMVGIRSSGFFWLCPADYFFQTSMWLLCCHWTCLYFRAFKVHRITWPTWHDMVLHDMITLRHMTFHDISWCFITLHFITLHHTTLHLMTLHYITLPYLTYITLHYIALHYITLHYITLHYITVEYNTVRYSTVQ